MINLSLTRGEFDSLITTSFEFRAIVFKSLQAVEPKLENSLALEAFRKAVQADPYNKIAHIRDVRAVDHSMGLVEAKNFVENKNNRRAVGLE